MNKQAAIFDLDGTILNTLADLADAVNYALGSSGFPRRSMEEVRRFVGNGIRKLIERSVPVGSGEDIIDRVHADFTAYYTDHCADKTLPYDGIPELLVKLRQAGWKIAVVSNKADYAVQALCRRYFDGLFDCAVGERRGVRKKPAPDSVLEVLRQLGCRPEQAVYIGDSDVDIDTARNAGTACVSVDWGFRDSGFLTAHGAQTIVSDPDALWKRLNG